jgi:ABC-type oligopeptide transport system substrate-binding subunit
MTDRIAIKFVNYEELAEKAQEREKALYKAIHKEGDYIVLDGYYEIPIADCNTHAKVCSWIAHLTEKNWVTTAMIHRLIVLTVGRERTP